MRLLCLSSVWFSALWSQTCYDRACALSPEAHLSGFLLLKSKRTEDRDVLKKSPQNAFQVGGKCKTLAAPVPTPEGYTLESPFVPH